MSKPLEERIGLDRQHESAGEVLTIADAVQAEVVRDSKHQRTLREAHMKGGIRLLVKRLYEKEWSPRVVVRMVRTIFGRMFPSRDCERNKNVGPPQGDPVYASTFDLTPDPDQPVDEPEEDEDFNWVPMSQVANVDAFRVGLQEREGKVG